MHCGFTLILLLQNMALLALAFQSGLPVGLAGDMVPAVSVCPSAETSSPNLAARVSLKA